MATLHELKHGIGRGYAVFNPELVMLIQYAKHEGYLVICPREQAIYVRQDLDEAINIGNAEERADHPGWVPLNQCLIVPRRRE